MTGMRRPELNPAPDTSPASITRAPTTQVSSVDRGLDAAARAILDAFGHMWSDRDDYLRAAVFVREALTRRGKHS